MDILFSNLLLESIFDFGKWSNWKYANTHICVFSVRPLPEVKNLLRKLIWNENVHVTILKKNRERFGQYLKKSKMDISLYFQKVIWQWQNFIFTNFSSSSETAKPLKIYPSIRFGGFQTCFFSFLRSSFGQSGIWTTLSGELWRTLILHG